MSQEIIVLECEEKERNVLPKHCNLVLKDGTKLRGAYMEPRKYNNFRHKFSFDGRENLERFAKLENMVSPWDKHPYLEFYQAEDYHYNRYYGVYISRENLEISYI